MVITRIHEKTAGAAPNARTCVPSPSHPRQVGKLTSYSEVVHYLLDTYETDTIIAEVDINIVNFKQLVGQSAVE